MVGWLRLSPREVAGKSLNQWFAAWLRLHQFFRLPVYCGTVGLVKVRSCTIIAGFPRLPSAQWTPSFAKSWPCASERRSEPTCYVRILHSKTSRFMLRQHARGSDQGSVFFLDQIFGCMPQSGLLFNCSANVFRARWSGLFAHLGINASERDRGITCKSLRGSGASWFFHHIEDLDRVLWRGRWSAKRTLEHYLQEVMGQVLLSNLPQEKHDFVLQLAAAASDLLSESLDCQQPCATWRNYGKPVALDILCRCCISNTSTELESVHFVLASNESLPAWSMPICETSLQQKECVGKRVYILKKAWTWTFPINFCFLGNISKTRLDHHTSTASHHHPDPMIPKWRWCQGTLLHGDSESKTSLWPSVGTYPPENSHGTGKNILSIGVTFVKWLFSIVMLSCQFSGVCHFSTMLVGIGLIIFFRCWRGSC